LTRECIILSEAHTLQAAQDAILQFYPVFRAPETPGLGSRDRSDGAISHPGLLSAGSFPRLLPFDTDRQEGLPSRNIRPTDHTVPLLQRTAQFQTPLLFKSLSRITAKLFAFSCRKRPARFGSKSKHQFPFLPRKVLYPPKKPPLRGFLSSQLTSFSGDGGERMQLLPQIELKTFLFHTSISCF